MPKNKNIELTLNERFQIWELACSKRKQILNRNSMKETPRTIRLLSIITKMGRC